MIDAAFRDYRLDAVERLDGAAARMLVPFTVLVRRDDGVLVRFDLLDCSRYLAARTAVDMLHVREQRRGTAAVVLMEFDPRKPVFVGEELQGPADVAVLVESAAGIRTCVNVRATSRAEAIDAAARCSHGRPIFARVRYVGVDRCAYCGIQLFSDMKIRETRRGIKCADCW